MLKITYIQLFILISFFSCGERESFEQGSAIEEFSSSTLAIKDPAKLDYSDKVDTIKLSFNTPQALGTLLSLNDTASFIQTSCTWFLISKNIALTNSHCLPKVLKKNDDLYCGDFLQGKISLGLGLAKRAKCKRVIKFSNVSKKVLEEDDYALIELEEDFLNIEVFELSRDGLEEDENIKIHTMNHSFDNGKVISKYLEHSCLVKSSDMFARINSKGSSPIVAFRDENKPFERCRTVSGNSGSAVVNSEGALVGILHGGLSNSFNSLGAISNNFGIITNLRCKKLLIKNLDEDIPLSCMNKKNKEDNAIVENLEQLMNDLDVIGERYLRYRPSLFKYFVQKIAGEDVGKVSYTLKFVPKCIVPLEQWPDNDYENLLRGSLNIKVHRLQVDSSLQINYYGNYYFNTEVSEKSYDLYSLSLLRELSEEEEVEVRILNKKVTLAFCES